MEVHEIDHPHNEASALLGVQNGEVLKKQKWEVAFWIVSDEREAAKAIAALGRTAEGEWEVVRMKAAPGKPWTTKRCEDCESLARAGSHVYVFGSQYGTKEGPLQPMRHFVARFNEALLDVSGRKIGATLDLVRRPFAIHRLVNDALRERGIEALPLDTPLQEAFVDHVARKGKRKKKQWKKLIRHEDLPINLEGATFVEGGRLLLGLRYPVTSGGHDDVIQGSPAARHANSQHWVFEYRYGDESMEIVDAELVRTFSRGARVEGVALDGDDVWYVHDDERIRLARDPAPVVT